MPNNNHPYQLAKYIELTISKRKGLDTSNAPLGKQLQINAMATESRPITQASVDRLVIDFFNKGLLPFTIVELPSFKALVGYDFFARKKRHAPMFDQLERYLSDDSEHLSGLAAYPKLRTLFVELNTSLPASAACERMLSAAGLIFKPLRMCIGDAGFEQ